MDREDGTRRPVRHSPRLQGFDYSSSAGYVVTICSAWRRPLFGTVRDGMVDLTDLGRILAREWLRTAEIRPDVLLDESIIMPNHLHGIVILQGSGGGMRGAVGATGPSQTLSAIVRGFKAACTAQGRKDGLRIEFPIWQGSFYDRIIRDDAELAKFRRYIANNPLQWELDRFHPNSAASKR